MSDPMPNFYLHYSVFYLYIYYLFYFEREEGKEKERERNINVWLPLTCAPPGDLARKPGMCYDWESNRRTLGSWPGAQSTEPHQPGLIYVFENHLIEIYTYLIQLDELEDKNKLRKPSLVSRP